MLCGRFNQRFQVAQVELGCVSSFPAIVFTSWHSLASADVMFRGQRSKGKLNVGTEALPLFLRFHLPWFTCPGPTWSKKGPRSRRHARMSQQTLGMKRRNQLRHLTSRPPPQPWSRCRGNTPAPADPKPLNEAALCLCVPFARTVSKAPVSNLHTP